MSAVIQWLEAYLEWALFIGVIVVGITLGGWDYLRDRRAGTPKQLPLGDTTENDIVRILVGDAMSGREVRWGSLVVTPKDRGPHIKTWRLETEFIRPMRVVGRDALEATVRKFIRAMRHNGRRGDQFDIEVIAEPEPAPPAA